MGQDDDCQILTVGSWYSMSGYGLAFPRGSKYLPLFNNKLMTYKDNGEEKRVEIRFFEGFWKGYLCVGIVMEVITETRGKRGCVRGK